MIDKYDRYRPTCPECGSKRCPWCGECHDPTDEVVRIDGAENTVVELCPADWPEGAGVRLYHERCLKKREIIKARVENALLDSWLEGSA